MTVDPLVALVAGDADQLAELTQVDTDPIPMTGVSADEVVEVGLALPTGVVAVNDEPITVTIAIRPVTETRTFSAGLDLVGDSSEFAYGIPIDRVLITVGGSTADLDRLSGATIVATLDVTGTHGGRPRGAGDGQPADRDHARRRRSGDGRRHDHRDRVRRRHRHRPSGRR